MQLTLVEVRYLIFPAGNISVVQECSEGPQSIDRYTMVLGRGRVCSFSLCFLVSKPSFPTDLLGLCLNVHVYVCLPWPKDSTKDLPTRYNLDQVTCLLNSTALPSHLSATHHFTPALLSNSVVLAANSDLVIYDHSRDQLNRNHIHR